MDGKWDLRFLELAKLVSTWSKDPSTQVGAVIVRPNKSVVSVGFNGFPMKMPDIPELYTNRTEKLSRIVHAEINASIFANGSIDGCTLYTYPCMPCDRCCSQLIQCGIIRMVATQPSEAVASRWAEMFNSTRKQCTDAKIELVELPLEI